MVDPQLSRLVAAAVSRLQHQMARAAPEMAGQVSAWMARLAGNAAPETYFTHPLAFPALLLPWWLEKSLSGQPDASFQADLVYATVNGYYAIRLVDNLMDGHATTEMDFLPALSFFYTAFQAAYRPYFEHNHPFWEFFTTVWLESAEATVKDAALTRIDAATFEAVPAKKTGAAKIPLAAVCYRHNQPKRLEPWLKFVDLFGCWHQMYNDLFDWHRDDARGTVTYFLCEAERRRKPHEPVAGWVAREGFSWAIGRMQGWMSALQTLARELNSPELEAYLHTRQAMLNTRQTEALAGLEQLAKIITAVHG